VHAREIKQILDTCRPHRARRVLIFERSGTGRIAVVAGKRIGGAVERNRARRVMRAAWREAGPLAGDRDAVLVARAPIAGASSNELADEMDAIMNRTTR
jgi:ribonuclease P protein component